MYVVSVLEQITSEASSASTPLLSFERETHHERSSLLLLHLNRLLGAGKVDVLAVAVRIGVVPLVPEPHAVVHGFAVTLELS